MSQKWLYDLTPYNGDTAHEYVPDEHKAAT
jgi:hypothetical protein